LYETLPVFHREGRAPQLDESISTKIDFLVKRRWQKATEEFQDDVAVVRLIRFNGEVRITFDEPQRMKLSSSEWKDTFMTRAVCRNVLIDLRSTDTKTVSYTIAENNIR
jgi:hypothetical protein